MLSFYNTIFFISLSLLAHLNIFTYAKVYVVYMGSINSEHPDEILVHNHRILSSVHSGSFEEAKASHLYSYKHGFKGFAAKLTEHQALRISKMEGVVSVFENKKRKLHTTHSWDFIGLAEEETMEIPGFSTSNQVNVIIGFIDTGIWPESPSFSDTDMPPVPAGWKGTCQSGEAFNTTNCNRKVIGARYYHSGYEAEEHSKLEKEQDEYDDDPRKKVSFRSPRDSNGHGSHTASTAAGRYVENMNYKGLAGGGARGGAPMARIAVYKTCWDSGCYDADILAAFDDAVRDGVHIVSLSLGPDAPQGDYFSDAISIGSFHAVSRGITVVSSVGNGGTKGSATNLAPWLITVAASSTDREFTSKLAMGNGVRLKGESLSVHQMRAPARIISASIANRGFFTPYQSSYCLESSLNYTKTRGKVLLCRHTERSTESKLAKSEVVKAAGGVGMILIDETDKDVAIPFVIPAAIVGKRMGNRILSYINNTRKPTSRIFASTAKLGSQPAPRIASFSSKGPNALTPEILKPDIAAPGLNILAAWSPAIGKMNFNIQSGTSMACPHVTGIVALIKAVHPSWSPSAIKSAIMTTATVFDKNGKPLRVDPEGRRGNAFDYGAGFLDPTTVLDPGLVYDAKPTDYKSFLCSIGYSDKLLHPITRDNSTCTGIAICKKATAGDKLEMKRLEEAYEEKKAESKAKEVELPCEAGVGFKKRKGISTPIERAFGVEIRDQLDQEIARMFYTGGLPFNLARNPHYHRAFQFAAANKIDGYVPPGYNKLRTTLLQKEKDNVHKLLEPLRSTWKEKGVTIVSDGWSDPTRKPLINFMATSGTGPLFLKAVNCFGQVKDRFFIADLMKEVINEIGHQNVVQIITDNAANCKAAGQLIESQFPHIYWTPCVVHTLNLALKNICSPINAETNALAYEQCNWIKEVHGDALTIKNFIMNHNMRLSIFTKFTPLRLLSVADTRFASIIVMLKRLKLIKRGLQAMVISEEWSSYREDDTVKANFVKDKIVDDEWWEKVSYILSFTGPIYEMIRVCDTDKPCLHLVYEMWDSMIEKVKIEIYKKEKRQTSQLSLFYDVVHGILVARWAKNNTPLHCLAHSLNPRYYSDAWLLEDSTRSAPHRDGEISQERMKCFRRLFPNDAEYSRVLEEYAMFSMKSGPFEDLTSISKMSTMEPKSWWVNFGAQTPFLQTLAFRLLGQPSSSSCAERNWSTYAFIHSLRRNKLTTSRAQDLVYIHNNLRLLSRNPNDDVKMNPNDDGKMWDVGGDAFDSMEDVGFLEVADLSLDEPDFENDLIIEN